jgi:phage shock protein E
MGFFSTLMGSSGSKELSRAIREGAFLVDVRTRQEFLTGSVPGAVNIPLDNLNSQLPLLRGKKAIVVFCMSGGRSGQAKIFLEQQGIQHVINGGTWQNVKQSLKSADYTD